MLRTCLVPSLRDTLVCGCRNGETKPISRDPCDGTLKETKECDQTKAADCEKVEDCAYEEWSKWSPVSSRPLLGRFLSTVRKPKPTKGVV